MPERITYHQTAGIKTASAAYAATDKRLEMNRFYAHPRWRRLRKSFLIENPLCDECKKAGRIEPAIDVHHIKERTSHPDLALDWDNLQSLCKPCHTMKSNGHGECGGE